STVRGARNYPCQEYPGKRAPTVALCRDPRGYVPIGTNPWRGPPIPYGTPVNDGRNILPPNHFPYIPPGADPDPGAPIVGPPPPSTTYDPRTGVFADPAGGTGIFAPGANGASSAENWVDLMRDPRPM